MRTAPTLIIALIACSHQRGAPRACEPQCPPPAPLAVSCRGAPVPVAALAHNAALDGKTVELQGAIGVGLSWCDLAGAPSRCCGDGRGPMVLRGSEGAAHVLVYLRGVTCGAKDGRACCPLPPDGAVQTFAGTLANNQGIWSLDNARLCASAAAGQNTPAT